MTEEQAAQPQPIEAFKCHECTGSAMVIVKLGAELKVFCANERCPGVGKPFRQLQVKFVPVTKKEPPQGATKVPS